MYHVVHARRRVLRSKYRTAKFLLGLVSTRTTSPRCPLSWVRTRRPRLGVWVGIVFSLEARVHGAVVRVVGRAEAVIVVDDVCICSSLAPIATMDENLQAHGGVGDISVRVIDLDEFLLQSLIEFAGGVHYLLPSDRKDICKVSSIRASNRAESKRSLSSLRLTERVLMLSSRSRAMAIFSSTRPT